MCDRKMSPSLYCRNRVDGFDSNEVSSVRHFHCSQTVYVTCHNVGVKGLVKTFKAFTKMSHIFLS